MTTQRKFEVVGFLFALVLVVVFAGCWLHSREDLIRAQAKATADEQVKAIQQQAISDRDELAKQYAAGLTAKAATITTPAAAVQVIEHYLPVGTVTQPIAQVKTSDLPASLQKQLPDSPSFTMLTPTEIQQLAKDELTCDAKTNLLSTCAADKASLQAELKASEDETATWKAAAKGGTKWQKFGHALKLIGCAAGGSAVGALADKSHPAVAAAVGGAGGAALCSIF